MNNAVCIKLENASDEITQDSTASLEQDGNENIPCLSTDSRLSTQALTNSFKIVNQRFFQGQIIGSIIWQVPKGMVSINKGTPCYTLNGPTEELIFEQATSAIKQGLVDKALALLTPFADKGHPDSELLVCHIKKRQHGDWQSYAKAYNDHFITEMLAPAACYYPDTQIIAIHPHLHRRGAPMFVLRYLIYHECCHQIIDSSESEPHPPQFMEYEEKAPFKEKALAWLSKEGFPTL